jgi:hypothetical protein
MTPATPQRKQRYDTLPNVSKGTSLQSFRIVAEKWRRLAERAKEAGTNRPTVLRQFIDWYNGEPGAELPTRPDDRPTS